MSYIQTPSRKRLSIRNTVSLMALSSIMIMGGCKSKTGDTDVVEDANIVVNSADYGDIGDILKLTPRKVTDAEAKTALKAIGLWEAGPHVAWDSRTGSAGQYRFKNIKVTAKDGQDISAKSLKLGGLHMDGETVRVDVADFSGLTVRSDDNKLALNIDHLGLTELPLSKNLSTISEIDDLLDFDPLDVADDATANGPKSVVFKGVSGTAEETTFDIDTLGWGPDPKDQHIRFAAEDLLIKIEDQSPVTLRLDSAKLRGLNPITPEAAKAANELNGQNGFLDMLVQNPQIGDMSIKGLDIQSDVFTLSLPSLQQSADQKGAVTIINSEMPQLTLGFTATDDLPADARQAMQVIESLGFDTMIFSAKSTTEMDKDKDSVTVKAASFDLEDGFDLNYKGKFSGLGRLNSLGPDTSPADLEAARDNIKIYDFAVSLEDKSIVERGFNLAGEIMEETPKSLRRQANGALAFGSLAAFTQPDGAIYSELARALGEFIQDGGTLTLQLNPEEPITLKDLDGLGQGKRPDLRRLGLSAAVTQ